MTDDSLPQFPQYPQTTVTVPNMPQVTTKTFTPQKLGKPLFSLARQMMKLKGKSTRLHQRKKVRIV